MVLPVLEGECQIMLLFQLVILVGDAEHSSFSCVVLVVNIEGRLVSLLRWVVSRLVLTSWMTPVAEKNTVKNLVFGG